MIKKIEQYFQRTKSFPLWRFVLEMSILAFLLKILFILIGFPIVSALGLSTETDLSFERSFLDDALWQTVSLIVLFAAFETITAQMFFLWLAKKISNNTIFRLILSSVAFALLHVEPMLVFAVFPIGLLLGWTYLIYRQQSLWRALWITTFIHALHNLISLWLVSLG